jgi:hypothetical protein
MPDDYGAPVSRGAMRAIYIGGTLAVGLLTAAVFAALSAAGWEDALPGPLPAFTFGFVLGTALTVVSGFIGRRRRRR